MNEEILRALAVAESVRNQPIWEYPPELQGPDDISAMTAKEVEELSALLDSLIPEDAKDRQEILYQRWSQLQQCIVRWMPGVRTEVMWEAAFNVRWDDEEKHQVVVEMSHYGPLASVFEYGPVPKELREAITSCIEFDGLIEVTREEREELETSGHYHDLF